MSPEEERQLLAAWNAAGTRLAAFLQEDIKKASPAEQLTVHLAYISFAVAICANFALIAQPIDPNSSAVLNPEHVRAAVYGVVEEAWAKNYGRTLKLLQEGSQ